MRGSGAEIFDAERHRSDWVHRFKSQRRGKEKGGELLRARGWSAAHPEVRMANEFSSTIR